jgi:hypothetical protein
MPTAPQQRSRALDPLNNRGMLRLKNFIAEGIRPETLAGLVSDNSVVASPRHRLLVASACCPARRRAPL